MDPDEIEFIAEKQTITIIPNFNSPVINFISGDVGPLRGGIPVPVPLWFALYLKQQQKCMIVPPEWMSKDQLEDLYNLEKNSKMFVKMPSDHYIVIAKLMLAHAADCVDRVEEVRTIIKDIWDIRMSKIRTSMDTLVKEHGLHAALDNLTLMEIHTTRPLLPCCLDQLQRLAKTNYEDSSQPSRNTTASHNSSSFI